MLFKSKLTPEITQNIDKFIWKLYVFTMRAVYWIVGILHYNDSHCYAHRPPGYLSVLTGTKTH